MNLVSDTVFRWVVTALTAGVGGTWGIIDGRRLWRLRDAAPSEALGDKRFGYGIGVGIGIVAILGCLMFWNVI